MFDETIRYKKKLNQVYNHSKKSKKKLCLTRRFIYKTVLSPPNLLYPKPRQIFRDYEDSPSWISNGFIIHLG